MTLDIAQITVDHIWAESERIDNFMRDLERNNIKPIDVNSNVINAIIAEDMRVYGQHGFEVNIVVDNALTPFIDDDLSWALSPTGNRKISGHVILIASKVKYSWVAQKIYRLVTPETSIKPIKVEL